jgi:hypothetical protein
MATSWEAEAARLSLFTLSPLVLASIDAVTGAPATQTINRPVDKTTFEVGTFGNYLVTIVTTPVRLDLFIGPNVQAAAQAPAHPVLGPANDTIRDLRTLSKKWITQPVDMQRLAVGLTMGHDATSTADALDLIWRQLPLLSKSVDPMQDFQIQINRPRASLVDSKVEINRIGKWQTIQGQMIQMAMAISGAQPAASVLSPASAFDRARVDIDINTSPKTTVVPGRMVINFVDELMNLAEEMAFKGDVP